ncbi:anti-sigma F factor [Mycobacteroides abscessus subsp. abscessus]|nr:anti-sigma F factor [Mycobacteroides abscessus subsp. abscessus]
MQKSIQISSYKEYEILEQELEEFIVEYAKENVHLMMYSIREAVNNAFEHGIKNNFSLAITITTEISGNTIIIEVEHNGEGFNHEEKVISVEDPDQYFMESLLSTRGRGIAIMKKCAKDIFYSEGGRKLTLLFELEK